MNRGIGDFISVTISNAVDARSATAADGDGWNYTLISRRPRDWIRGERVEAWVVDCDKTHHTICAFTDEFGRLPVSDRMRPRYLLAMRAALKCGITNLGETELSELKGLFNRILRRDQQDWFSVWCVLGRPDLGLVRTVVNFCGSVRKSRRDGRPVQEPSGTLDLQMRSCFERAISALQGVPRTLARTKAPRSAQSTTIRSDRRVISAYALQKLRDANHLHGNALAILKLHLDALAVVHEENAFVDLFARLKSGPALFEVKSIHEANVVSQMRTALGQLYEYRYRERIIDASLWMLFSRRPNEAWIIEFLEQDRDVRVLWIEDDSLSGPSLERLEESGSLALLRSSSLPGRK